MNKVLEDLNNAIEFLEHLYCEYGMKEISESMSTIKELIDKVTPKKVILHFKHHLGTAWGTYLDRVNCPSCKRRLKERVPNNQAYCPKCGQKLDWSEFTRCK